jgi:Flp pilus assembly protein TadG
VSDATAVRAPRDRGQAAVEFAIALPMVVVLVLGLLHVVIVARDQLALELAARDGARAAAVAADPTGEGAAAARAATSLTPLDVAAAVHGERVTVTVRYASRPRVPILGAVLRTRTLSASATMLREPP